MLQVKSFIVKGDTVTRNGHQEKSLGLAVDKEVNEFLSNLDGELVDIKIEVSFFGASGDYAFVTVLYKGEKKVEKVEKSKK